MGELVRCATWAAEIGVDPRSVTRWRQRGLPAQKIRGIWHVDPALAAAWAEENAPRAWNRRPLALADHAPESAPPEKSEESPTATPRRVQNEKPEPPPETELESLDRHIERLSSIFTGLLQTVERGHLTPQLLTGIKQTSGELRQLEKHRLEMRAAEANLISREDHEEAIGTIANAVALEVDTIPQLLPDLAAELISEAGITLRAPRKHHHALRAAAETTARRIRASIADRIQGASLQTGATP